MSKFQNDLKVAFEVKRQNEKLYDTIKSFLAGVVKLSQKDAEALFKKYDAEWRSNTSKIIQIDPDAFKKYIDYLNSKVKNDPLV